MRAEELLILNYRGYSPRLEGLFQKLHTAPSFREIFVKDPAGVFAKEAFPEHNLSPGQINQGNRLLFSLLSNPKFMEWRKRFEEKIQEQVKEAGEKENPAEAARRLIARRDRSQVYKGIAQASLEFIDLAIIHSGRIIDPDSIDLALQPDHLMPGPDPLGGEFAEVAGESETLVYAVAAAAVAAVAVTVLGVGSPATTIEKLSREDLRQPKNRMLSIMPTFQCTAECEHCGTISSPREKTWLPLDDMLAAIDQAAENGYKIVTFTGGEATLTGKNLLLGIKKAVSHGLVARLVTNAYWANSDKAAKHRIEELVFAGLTQINFSTGDQHARFIPLENVFRATRAVLQAGLPATILIETLKERTITKELVENHSEFRRIREDFPRAIFPRALIMIYESPWTPLTPSMINQYPEGMAVNRSNLAMRKGCTSILSTTTIQADGKISPCCGLGIRLIPELQLGNIGETNLAEADRSAADDFLKRWIRVEGPEKILAWASTHDPEIKWEDMYTHQCQACMRLYKDQKVRKVIAEHHQEKIADIFFAEWLLFNYRPNDGDSSKPEVAEGIAQRAKVRA